MAQVGVREARVAITVNLTVDENEAKALLYLSQYGGDELIKALGDGLGGKRKTEENREGLMSLTNALRNSMPGVLHRVEMARDAFVGPLKLKDSL